jgi:hypothetical protein
VDDVKIATVPVASGHALHLPGATAAVPFVLLDSRSPSFVSTYIISIFTFNSIILTPFTKI